MAVVDVDHVRVMALRLVALLWLFTFGSTQPALRADHRTDQWGLRTDSGGGLGSMDRMALVSVSISRLI